MKRFISISTIIVSLSFGCGRKATNVTGNPWIDKTCFGHQPDDVPAAMPQTLLRARDTPLALVKGTGRIYDRDSLGSLVDVELNITTDGTLTNNDFFTAVPDGERAKQQDLRFVYDKSDLRFEEVAVFANANTTLAWFKSAGMPGELSRIGLSLPPTIGGSANNAFLSFDGDGNSSIYIGPGDGKLRQNLRTDRDVMTHEMAHALIYRRVQGISGESLVIHEGLADGLTVLRNDDPCVARSTCPAGNTLCVVTGEKSCLRTADNSLNWQTVSRNNTHLGGQIISGMLWDLRKEKVISQTDLTRLVITAIERLPSKSQIQDLIAAYREADQILYQSSHVDSINRIANARGLL